MAIKFLDAINLTGLEIQNVLAQNSAGNPATALGEGQFFFDSTVGVKSLKYWKLEYPPNIIILSDLLFKKVLL